MECDLVETDILESLEDLGYKGPLLEDGALSQAVSAGASSPEFTKLCAWLVSELRVLCKLEENVQATNSPGEAEEFQLEVSGLLGEMNCPYLSLTSGDVTKRLLVQKNCLLLLTYLISELEAARMLCVNTPPKKAQEGGGSEVFQELKGICIALGMSKPPANITMFQFFSGIEKKLKETLAKVPPNHVGKPLLKKSMGPAHWEKIEAINQAIANEYEVRRKLLIKRLDVTVQSFGWSDRAKSQTEKLAKVYQPKRSLLSPKSTISVAHLLAARQDLSKILRTSSGSVREKTACSINKVLMGRVPDRGGRPNEIEPPPPEMPPWQKRQDGPQQQTGGRGGGRGGYEQSSYGGRGGHEQGGGRGGRGGYDHGGRGGGRGNKHQGGWTDGGMVATKVVVMVATKHLHTQEVDTRVVATSRTIDTKMVGTMVIEAVVAEGGVAVEAEVDAEARGEVGEEGGARVITRGDSLNSTSSMEDISIIILDLDREDITPVEATEPFILLELK
uniref:Family with sequence similarity 98 member A n=1 Tax=Rousettus aegyptiacus TaxID=9407 RepID=A0A7J8FGE8_ROUAE|nr:family with sequence similarity 98 member A [Rousettus aegyptiacus]